MQTTTATRKGLATQKKISEKPSFEALYTATYKDLVIFCQKQKQCSKEEAQDIASHVFEKAQAAYQDFVLGGCKPFTWLCGIARNLIIDNHRRVGKYAFVSVEGFGNVPETTQNHNGLDYIILHKAISNLLPMQQTVISMYYFEELKYEEIAETLQIPLGTVKNCLHLGKKQLATVLSKVM
jgi:RNA polymerase sigma-70 factor, ECF subfamily